MIYSYNMYMQIAHIGLVFSNLALELKLPIKK
jgi:hypothetical protein